MSTTDRPTPKHHQLDAARAAIAELATADRATIVLPCGTGKTLIAELVAAKCLPETAILFFPSIALIRQTLAAWKRDKPLGEFDCLCVCSDETVADDESDIHVSDLVEDGATVTTDSKEISRFMLDGSGKPKVLFSTYQSSRMIRLPRPADLVIMDEAHRTAGKDGLFSHALDDANLPAKKRLFMTATPRHAQADSSDTKSFSMLDEAVYGRICYLMSISDAIKQNLICDYKIVVSVVTDDIAAKLESENIGSDPKMLAIAAAIRSATEEFGVSKIITFHNSVASAKHFASDASARHILDNLSDIHHVNGKMRLAERSKTLRSFAESKAGLVTNARCLTEGVDIPAVDMVVIAGRRTSVTDIVQSSGRALRLHEGKKVGYIAIPLMLDQAKGETIEQAIRRSGFTEVWRVVNAMREQDMMLADGGPGQNEQKRKLRERAGDTALDKIEVVGVVGDKRLLSEIKSGIRSVLAERINTRSWDETFEILIEQHNRFGTWKFGKVAPEYEFLDTWLQTQRKSVQNGTISVEKRKALEAVGLDFLASREVDRWGEKLAAFVKEFKETGKHPKSRWVDHQRAFWKSGKLSKDKEERLAQAGFVFDPMGLGKDGSRKTQTTHVEVGSVQHEEIVSGSKNAPSQEEGDIDSSQDKRRQDAIEFAINARLNIIADALLKTSRLQGAERYRAFAENVAAVSSLQSLLESEETDEIHGDLKERWLSNIKPRVREVFSHRG